MAERGLREVQFAGRPRLSTGLGHSGDEPEVPEIEMEWAGGGVRYVAGHEPFSLLRHRQCGRFLGYGQRLWDGIGVRLEFHRFRATGIAVTPSGRPHRRRFSRIDPMYSDGPF